MRECPLRDRLEDFGAMVVDPRQYTIHIKDVCQVSSYTLRKTLKKNELHPYKIQMVHQLTENDLDRRVKFCEIKTQRIVRHPKYLYNICFTNERTFFKT